MKTQPLTDFLQFILALGLFIWVGPKTYSQTILLPQEAVEIALKNNFNVIIAQKDLELASQTNTIGNAGALPEVNIDAGGLGTNRNLRQLFVSGNEVNQDNVHTEELNYSVNVNWTLYDGMRMFVRKKIYEGEEVLKSYELKNQIQEVVEQLLVQYYTLSAESEMIKVLQTQKDWVLKRLELAESRALTGLGAQTDVLLSKLDLNAVESEIQEQKHRVFSLKQELLSIMASYEWNSDFEVQNEITTSNRVAQTFDSLSISHNPMIMAFRNRVLIARLQVQETHSFRLPEVRFSGNYSSIRSQADAGFLLRNRNYGLNYGLTAHLTLFNGGQLRTQYRNAQTLKDRAEVEMKHIEWEVMKAQKQAIHAFKTYSDLCEKEQANVSIAESFLNLAHKRYEQGVATILELKEAQNQLAEVQNRLYRFKLMCKMAEIQYLKSTGELVS